MDAFNRHSKWLCWCLFTGFTVNYAGSSSTTSVQIDVQPVADFTMSGPLDGRISTQPGQAVDVNLDLDNSGTMDLDLTASSIRTANER